MNLLETYTKMLETTSCKINESDEVCNLRDKPLTIDGKKIAIPTKQILKKGDKDTIVFHPLYEQVQKGETELFQFYKKQINLTINKTISLMIVEIMRLALANETHQNMNGDQISFLSEIGEVDQKSVDNFMRLLTSGLKQADRMWMNIFVKRGGSINEEKYNRVGVVTFPAVDILCGNDKIVFGSMIRKKDRVLYNKIFLDLINDCAESFHYGTNSFTAPSVEALMGAYFKITERLNEISDSFKEVSTTMKDLHNDVSDLKEQFKDIEDLDYEIKTIPSQGTNKPIINNEENVSPVNNVTTNPVRDPTNVLDDRQNEVVEEDTGGTKLSSLFGNRNNNFQSNQQFNNFNPQQQGFFGTNNNNMNNNAIGDMFSQPPRNNFNNFGWNNGGNQFNNNNQIGMV